MDQGGTSGVWGTFPPFAILVLPSRVVDAGSHVGDGVPFERDRDRHAGALLLCG